MLSQSIVYRSEVMCRLLRTAERIAALDVTVLLSGESGTGKERVAEALVAASSRADKPFLRFNCAALTAELAEAELFGHAKGAFTGAFRTRPGLFREADRGTILLDEIGEMSPVIQAKLLRVLQEGEVRPVGEDRSVRVDARIIAATNRDLLTLTKTGRFRADLYYRLNVVHLQVPPLRERAEDVPELARHFLERFSNRFGVGPFSLTADVLERLNHYSWPGNVRELENAIESVVALSQGEIDLSLLPDSDAAPSITAMSGVAVESATARLELKALMAAYERQLIVAALNAAEGNRTRTARVLGINRATLHGKLRKHGLATADEALDD